MIKMQEQRKHIDAFNYWFALTEKGHSITQAIEVTAEHCGVNIRTVWKWHDWFEWKERANERRIEIQKELEKKDNQTLAENKANYLKILHKLLDDYIKNGFPAQIESVRDLETVIKNCLVLQNSPTEVIKNNTTNINVDADSLFDEELMRKIVEQEAMYEEDYVEEQIEYDSD